MTKQGTKPAVGYIRMSTDKQEDSPEQQRAEIVKLAKREGYDILRWYEDHGISGAKTHKRQRFVQMVRDAEEQRDFRAILCWDQDRFGRFDSIEAGEWVSPLRRAGVELVTVVQGRIAWDDFAGRMIYQITQEGKHRYLVDLSKNSLRGMIRFAKQGHILGYRTPYGYDREYYDANGKRMCRIGRTERFRKPRDWRAKFVPSANRQEVETVRWLFRNFTEKQRTARSLAIELTRRGVPAPLGGEWDATFVRVLLANPVYIGCLTYGRRGAGLYHHVGSDGEIAPAQRGKRDHGRYAPIMVANNHEALIDEATFAAAQEQLRTTRSRHGRPVEYLLAGLLRCGHCGGKLVGNRSPMPQDKSQQYHYYVCRRAAHNGTCRPYSVRTDVIESALIQRFREGWLTEGGRTALRQAIEQLAKQQRAEQPERRGSLEGQLDKLEQQIAQGTENLLLAAPADVPAATKILAKWRKDRDRLMAELADVTAGESRQPRLDANAVMAELDRLEEHLDAGSVPLARSALRRVFKSASLHWVQVSPRRCELVRAEVETAFPFA